MPAPNPLAIFAPGLNQAGVVWMAVGSIASNAYGEFRTTNDVDLIVVISPTQANAMAAAFPIEKFYCPSADVIKLEAERPERGHFNLIHHETAFKADVYIARHDSLQDWALQHRRELIADNVPVWIAPPEYVIIGKLEFFRESGSEKHLRDIRAMLAVTEIDRELLAREISSRGLEEIWRQSGKESPRKT
jgi:hypothetical protein